MIHTVKLDDNTKNGKMLLKQLRRYKVGVEIENPFITGVPPEGYMTADDFREKTTEDLKQLCIKHGILQ